MKTFIQPINCKSFAVNNLRAAKFYIPKLALICIVFMPINTALFAQLKIGDNPSTIKAASLLEMESSNKGLVFPRVNLTALNTAAPLSTDLLQGTVVYNTNTALDTGLYVWKKSGWVFVQADNLGNHTATKNINLTDKLLVGGTVASPGTSGISISAAGNVGIGTTAANAQLEVYNSFKILNAPLTLQTISQTAPSTTGAFSFQGVGTGQSFTLPVPAIVTQIDLYKKSGIGGGPFNLQINYSSPSGKLISTQPVIYPSANGVVPIVLSTPLNLPAGIYSFSTNTTTGALYFDIQQSDVYSGGAYYSNLSRIDGWELNFAVHYTPQPSFTVNSLGSVGIGTNSPSTALDVIGQIKISDGNQAAGKVLTCDNTGLASWVAPQSIPTFNSGSVLFSDGSNISQSNSQFFWDNATSRLGLGTTSPSTKLDVYGTGRYTNDGEALQLAGTGTGSSTYASFFPDGTAAGQKAYIGYSVAANQNFTLENKYPAGDMSIATGRDLWFRIGGTDKAIIKGATGYMGVGTTSPGQKLEVAGVVYANDETSGFVVGDNDARVGLLKYSGRSAGIWRTSIQSFEIGRVNTSALPGTPTTFSTDFFINGAGNIGIGTTNPGTNAKVEIVGGVTKSGLDYRYLSYGGEGSANGGGSYSLYTSGRIWCASEINVTSDMRTKTNIVSSKPVSDLGLINKLRVVNYNYKDKVSKGNATVKGFLAQEVEKIMPDAVTQNNGVIPNIYRNAIDIQYDKIAKTLTLTLPSAVDMQAGDTVKLITDNGEKMAHVQAVNSNHFTVSNWNNACDWAFVYGKQVNDLRNLDYNKLFSAGIGAIQELSQQNDALKKDVELLKAQLKIVMEKMNTVVKAD